MPAWNTETWPRSSAGPRSHKATTLRFGDTAIARMARTPFVRVKNSMRCLSLAVDEGGSECGGGGVAGREGRECVCHTIGDQVLSSKVKHQWVAWLSHEPDAVSNITISTKGMARTITPTVACVRMVGMRARRGGRGGRVRLHGYERVTNIWHTAASSASSRLATLACFHTATKLGLRRHGGDPLW